MGDSNSTILDPWPPLAPGLLLVMPSNAFGSDYTALYFLFMEVPILVLSLLVLGICFVAPKVGRVLVAILFAGVK